MAFMEKSALSIVMVVALVATSFLQLHARSIDLPEQEGNQVVYSSSGIESEKPCCDKCYCTRSIPPQCRCADIKPFCQPSCKLCVCTRSWPPQCRCTDVKDHCDKECPSAYTLF